MICWAIRQKSTGYWFPQTGRGSTYAEFKAGVPPRLFRRAQDARSSMKWWQSGIHWCTRSYSEWESDESYHEKEIPERKTDDYEVVKVGVYDEPSEVGLVEQAEYYRELVSTLYFPFGNFKGDHIYGIDCPECKKLVWVNNGDTSDVTIPDTEAVQCPWCDRVFPIPGSDKEMFDPGFCDQGYKSPNDACRFKGE
jgi:hypothetical protein